MNVTSNDALSNPMSPELELNVAAPAAVDKARGKRASNDAAVDAPISAVDAMALCMKDSAIGG